MAGMRCRRAAAGAFLLLLSLPAGAGGAPPQAAACVPSDTTLCLGGGRFRLEGTYSLQDNQGSGPLRFVRLTDAAGYFTFKDTSDVQAVVKVLDVCGFASRFWVFLGALTDQQVHLEVADLATGARKVYDNALKHPFLPVYDLDAFATCGAAFTPTGPGESGGAGEAVVMPWMAQAQSGLAAACLSSSTSLCLGGRFLLEGTYRLQDNQGGGPLRFFPLTSASGYFTYADTSDVQAVVKVLDVCGFAGRFWVFVGALTDQEVVLKVTDTATGDQKSYSNPLKTPLLPIYDLQAFATCQAVRCTF